MADKPYAPLPVRGVHLDCRAQMLRFDRVLEVLEDLARWGCNTVLLEYENRFPFTGRLRQVAASDTLTKGQVREINRVAAGLGLQIMPLVQCLGHLEYVVRFPRFRRLVERRVWSPVPYAVCPTRPGGRKLLRELARQVLDLHPDCRWFHMGGDEVGLNPDCPDCGGPIRDSGVARVIVEHYVDHADWLRTQGPDPVMWGDVPLCHHEALDLLRGHVTIMDWDYFSPIPRGRSPWLWHGIFPDGVRTAWQRELAENYVFKADGKTPQPFPYTRFLRDRGFPVIVASAARCVGDTFCVPFPAHVDNTIAAARKAHEAHVLGSVVTNWSVRRSPWPLTEYGLFAGAMAMNDPRAGRKAIDAAFAEEHFGRRDAGLAKIATLLGTQLRPLLDAHPEFQTDTGRWLGGDYATRLDALQKDVPAYKRQLRRFRSNIAKARKLLATVRPGTPRQRRRVALWAWAAEVLGHFADFGEEVLKAPGTHEDKRLKAFRAAAVKLARRTDALLGRYYTAPTVEDERQIRFGVHLDYLDAMIAACNR